MKGGIIGKGLIGIFFLISIPGWALASEGKPVCPMLLNPIAINHIMADTVPPSKKITEAPADKPVPNDKPVAKVIKVVPKARRQTVPVPVNVKIKPVKIIKPKIIKPVIRVLH